jgi:hypothetical protein
MSQNIEITDKYIDPPNTPEIVKKLEDLQTLGEVKDLIEKVFPDWFVTTMNNYCIDYPHLTTNWHQICKLTKSQPTQIVIVEEIVEDKSHSLTTIFAECLTRAGFSVRRKREYIPCESCNNAIPNSAMWKLFKDNKVNVPSSWSNKCSTC